ncbi:helix-turn-helix domain-containing protein [Hymenobacter jejuensis]|uniref:Helix-turn-helix domain-containing protein n=1 Tax=Hymenobacter jejuensis TaxID=2502781 RepID=A0A5B8A508_9BACT|nr:helix-turn-helix domain-containing protein [Hymenobacter jejuensis]QDA62307.1 helix-turn-helix domain-containing protein [Hymenobacter jejuensis]
MLITSPLLYKEALRRLDELTSDRTSQQGDPDQSIDIQHLTSEIEAYEARLQLLPLPMLPTTLADMIELKRQQLQLKQKELAQLLEVPAGRLSQILSGKRRVTLDLAKKLYERLGISPEFILKTA